MESKVSAAPTVAARRRLTPLRLAVLLAVLLVFVVVFSARMGSTGSYGFGETSRGILALLGWSEPLEGGRQIIVELRLYRTLTAVGVGSALALSGGLLQGVFRNDLASPSIIGVSTGASLGAAIAILSLGGYGPLSMMESGSVWAPYLVSASAFTGAIVVVSVVTTIASRGGRISVPSLLLVGIAMNAVAGGLMAALQSLTLGDVEVGRAILAWTFGTLDDRASYHVGLIFGALVLSALVIPRVALDLDLFASGEEDAESLGVNTQHTKTLVLIAACIAAAVAVSVAGQITFVGLVVPHILRLLIGRSHRVLLPMCLLGGPVFFLGADVLQRWILGDAHLEPGVTMSLVGGPFFLFLLVRNRELVRSW